MPHNTREKQLAAQRLHYENNKDLYKERSKIRSIRVRKENRHVLYNYLLEHPCVDCGEADPVVLHFDHLRDKVMAISRMFNTGYSWERIKSEIDKCEVVCANCHMRRTATRSGWFKLNGEEIVH